MLLRGISPFRPQLPVLLVGSAGICWRPVVRIATVFAFTRTARSRRDLARRGEPRRPAGPLER